MPLEGRTSLFLLIFLMYLANMKVLARVKEFEGSCAFAWLAADGFSKGPLSVVLVYKPIQLEVQKLLVGRQKVMPGTSIDKLEPINL